MTHQSLVDQSIKLFQDLPLEIVAVPQDNYFYSNTMLSHNLSSPINIKIRYKNKEVTGTKRGVISVSRLGAKQNSKNLRLIKSDQTIMSFDLLLEADKHKTSQKKHQNKILKIFKTGCFSTQNNNDDEYTYLPSSSFGDNKIPEVTYDTNDVTADKFALRKNFSSVTRKTPIFLGKCKPGGCLDPPFNEDKYSYEPTTKLSITPPKVEDQYYQKLAQEDIPSMTINETNVKTKAQNYRKNKESLQSKLESKFMEETFSDLIITYPPVLSSSEIQMRKASQNSATKAKMSCEKISKQSINELTEIFYKPLKREKSKNLDEPCRIQQGETSYDDVDNSQNSQSQRKMLLSVPQNCTLSTVKLSKISLPKDKTGTPTVYSTITQVEKSITSLEKLTPILETTKIKGSKDITEFCAVISKNPEESLVLTDEKIKKSEISVSKEILITQDKVKSSIFLVQDVTSTTTIETKVLETKEIDEIKSIHCLSLKNKEITSDDNQINLMPAFDMENKSFETLDNFNVKNYSLSTQKHEIPLSINEKRNSDIDKEKDLEEKLARSYEHFVSIQDKITTSTDQLKISKSSSNIERKSSDNLFTILNQVKLSESLSKTLLDNELRDSKNKDSILIRNHENSFIIRKENLLPSFDMKPKYNIEEIPLTIENPENYYDIKDAIEEMLNNILKHIKTYADDPISDITLSSNNIPKIYSYEFDSKNISEHTLDIHQNKEVDNIDVSVNDVEIKQTRWSSNISYDYVKNSESLKDIINVDTSLSKSNGFSYDDNTLGSILNNINTFDFQVENITEETEELLNNKVPTNDSLQHDYEYGTKINKSTPTISIHSMVQTFHNKDDTPDKDYIQNRNTKPENKINLIFSKEKLIPLLHKHISIKSQDKIDLNRQSLEEKIDLSYLKYYKSANSLSLHPVDVVLKNQEQKSHRGDNMNDIYAPADLMISNSKNNTNKINTEFLDRPLSKHRGVSHLQKEDIDIYKEKGEKSSIENPKRYSEKPNIKYGKDFPINFSKSGSCIETTVMNNNKLCRKLDTPAIDINFRFVYCVNEKNDLVLQTCDPIHPISAMQNTNKKEVVVKKIIRKYDDEIRIPLNSQTDLTLEIKKTNNNSRKPKEQLGGIKVVNNDLLLQETLHTVYQNLLSLEIMIRNLRKETKSLSQQQVLIKDLLTSLETKPERLVDHKGRCKCHKI